MAKKKIIEIEADATQAKSALGQIVDLFKKMVVVEKEAQKEAKETEKAVEGVGKGASKAKKGVKSLASGFKGLGTALKATGIGLFIGLLALLKEAFEGNEKVQKAFKVGAEFVTAVVGELVDVIDNAVTSVADASNGFESLGKVLSGLMTLAITPLKLAFLGIGRGIAQAQLLWEKSFFGGNDADKIKELEKSIAGYDMKFIEAGASAVKAGKDIVKNFGGAISEVGKLGGAIVDGLSEVDIQANILRSKTEEADKEAEKKAEERKNRAIKRAQKEADEKARILEGERAKLAEIEANYVMQKEDMDAVSREEKLELDRKRAQEDLDALLLDEAEKKDAQIALDAVYDEKAIELESIKTSEKKAKEARDYAEGKANKDKIAEEDEKREKLVQDAKIGLANNAFKLAGALAEEGSALAKGVQVAQTIMSTIQGVQSAYTTAQKSPYTTLFPGYPLVQAGLAGAFGAISVQKILATPTSSSGGGAPSVNSGGGGSAPPAFNLVGGSGVDEIGDTLQGETEPVKAYVVGADVTNQQEIDNAQAESASLG